MLYNTAALVQSDNGLLKPAHPQLSAYITQSGQLILNFARLASGAQCALAPPPTEHGRMHAVHVLVTARKAQTQPILLVLPSTVP